MKKIAEENRGRKEEGYFWVCTFGGILSAGITHVAVTPLDVLKVNMQVNPVKYYSIASCLSTLLREQGPSVLWRGWATKFIGYGMQGGCRFGLYEYFKKLYSNVFDDRNRNLIFFGSSASAEVVANIVLCPFEAIKIRVQSQHYFGRGLLDGFPKLYKSEGLHGFYRGLVPLWGRNLPFSMVMFSTFEHTVDFLYTNVLKSKREDCSKLKQLGITCLAGYTAGTAGSLVSNPADNIVTALYNRKADTLKSAIQKIGVVNLFTRSLPIRIILVGPVVTLQWFFYDCIKVFNG
ncbi:hypothetical protein KSS87_018944, partial [Heliosperma pusillum]